MKNLLLLGITIYQRFFSCLLKNILGIPAFCRFSPSCSEYAKKVIIRHGASRGLFLAAFRVISCNPFNRLAKSI